MKHKKPSIPAIQAKKNNSRITMLTCYDSAMAKILDRSPIDLVLVGDSLGQVCLGYDSTIPVSLADMLHHVSAVTRSMSRTVVVADMPFGSYQIDDILAMQNAVRLIQAGAHAVKIEGAAQSDLIRKLVGMGIPVMGHIGLTPQSIHVFGGYRVQGRSPKDREDLLLKAKILEESGVFSFVVEGVPATIAAAITRSVSVPTIGIGAGAGCDGQVLVINDMLGMDPEFNPKFVKRYTDLNAIITQAVADYVEDVVAGRFPADEHVYRE